MARALFNEWLAAPSGHVPEMIEGVDQQPLGTRAAGLLRLCTQLVLQTSIESHRRQPKAPRPPLAGGREDEHRDLAHAQLGKLKAPLDHCGAAPQLLQQVGSLSVIEWLLHRPAEVDPMPGGNLV